MFIPKGVPFLLLKMRLLSKLNDVFCLEIPNLDKPELKWEIKTSKFKLK